MDGNPSNNTLANLEYGTRQQNIDDMVRHGTRRYGETALAAKVTEDDVREIRWLKSLGVKTKILSIGYGVSDGAITSIVNGTNWKHIPVIPYTRCWRHRDISVTMEVLRRRKEGQTASQIAEAMNRKTAYIHEVIRRERLKSERATSSPTTTTGES